MATKNAKTASKNAPKTAAKNAPKTPKPAPWMDMASVGKAAIAAQEKAPKAAPAAQEPKAPKAPKAAPAAAPAAQEPKARKVDFGLLSTPDLRKLCKVAKGEIAVAAKAALAARLAVETTKAAAAPAAAPAPAAVPAPTKAAKAPKAEKAAKARNVNTNSAVHAPETLEACQGKAPKGDSIHAHFLQFLAHNAASNSEAFVGSLRRPLGEFMDFLKAQRITTWAQLDSKTLVAYRKAAKQTESGEARAVSTMRMSLARVITFLRAQEEGLVNADVSLLRVKLSAEEKQEKAEAAFVAEEE